MARLPGGIPLIGLIRTNIFRGVGFHLQKAMSMPSFRGGCLVFAVALAVSPRASAIDLPVPSAQFPTIQSAINAASSGDVVRVAPGIFNERLNLLGKQISLVGAGPFLSVIDPQGGGGHLLTCASGETTATVVQGFTFRLSPTGAVYLNGSGITLRSCRLQSNSGSRGAAILGEQGSSAVLDQCVCSYNSASDSGGALFFGSGSTLTIVNSTMQGNTAGSEGGAMYVSSGSSLSVTAGAFVENSAQHGGGAIRLVGTSGTVTGVQFSSNRAGLGASRNVRGGSLLLQGQSPRFSSCTFNDCLAVSEVGGCCEGNLARGGSVFAEGGSLVSFESCSWNRPTARSASGFQYRTNEARGGAIYLEAVAGATLSNCSFLSAASQASRPPFGAGHARGGAVFMHQSNPLFSDCIFLGCAASGDDSGSGGALGCSFYASPMVLGSRFSGCSARFGGVVHMEGLSSPSFGTCEFLASSASDGGGVAFANNAPALFFDSLFQGNSSNDGSVLRASGPQVPTFVNNDLCSNSGIDFSGSFTDGGGNEVLKSCPEDCNGNGLNDDWDLENGFADCDSNGILDVCDIAGNPERDCDGDGTLDSCQGDKSGEGDCDSDGVPDACEPDCDADGTPDDCAIASGMVPDCNLNGIPDSCDLPGQPDCNSNGVPDSCDPDCDSDGVPNACEIASGAPDCDSDGVPDACEIAANAALDINRDAVLDSCQPGMEFAGLQVEIVPVVGRSGMPALPPGAVCYRVYAKVSSPETSVAGYYGNLAHPLVLAAAGGFWNHPSGADLASDLPCGPSGLPPEVVYDSWLTIGRSCEDGNDVQAVDFDFLSFNAGAGVADDNAVVFVLPGSAQSVAGASRRVLLAQLTVTQPVALGGSLNLVGRNSSGAAGASGSWIALGQQIPAPDMLDCNGNGVHDAFDIASGAIDDCNDNGVPDTCEDPGAGEDCNGNGESDFCDILSGHSTDANSNGVPDECECLGDLDGNGRVDADDLVSILVHWGGDSSSGADVDGDGSVDGKDLGLVLAAWGPCD